MQKDDLRLILFAGAVCVVCSLLLSTTASSLRERQAKNVELYRKVNVLKAFGVEVQDQEGKALSEAEVDRYFTDHISEVIIDKATGEVKPGAIIPKEELKARNSDEKTVLPLYVWKDGGQVTKYAFPVSGMGLWSVIYGYLALDKDLATIVGVTFYKHGETPGLGGEISTEWFQDQFKGRCVWQPDTQPSFEVVKGSAAAKYPNGNCHAVDGITGATMTGNGLTTFLTRDLQYYEKYFSKVRGG